MAPVRHILKEIAYLKTIHQWCATCSCGHESYDETKAEAMNWHRDHVDLARQRNLIAGNTTQVASTD
jgi:hypothetical protein